MWFQGFTLHMNMHRFPGLNFYYTLRRVLLIDEQHL